MNLTLPQISIFVIVAIALIILAVRQYRAYKNKTLNLDEVLTEFTAVILSLAKNIINMIAMDISHYGTEEEFRKELATEVTQALLIELEGTPTMKYIELVSVDNIILFVEKVFALYENELSIKEVFTSSIEDYFQSSKKDKEISNIMTMNDRFALNNIATEAVETDKIKTTNITSEINNFYQE